MNEKDLSKSRLYVLLSCLSKREHNSFQHFLDSPYFNRRKDVIDLYQVLCIDLGKKSPPAPEKIWQQLKPETIFSLPTFRLVMSYLSRLIEQFLAIEDIQSKKFDRKMRTASTLRNKGVDKLAHTLLKEAKQELERSPHRHANYWLQAYQHQAAYYPEVFTKNPEKNKSFGTFSIVLDQAFLAMKLRQNMARINHEQVYQWQHQPSVLDHFVASLSEAELPQEAAHLLYFYGSRLLEHPDDEAAFQKFKETLFANDQLFPAEEGFELYNLAINFGIRQVNRGNRTYFHHLIDLYKNGLTQGYLLRKGILSRFTYHNVVSIALQIDEIAWAENFIDIWTNKLERRYRERMYNFNRAKIAYSAQNYDEALLLLQQSNYHDTLINLGVRTLLLKIYYELAEWEVLYSHLDAFQKYIRRKPELTYHSTNYYNLIHFTRKLLKLEAGHKKQKVGLQEQIEEVEILTEKDWLLAQLLG